MENGKFTQLEEIAREVLMITTPDEDTPCSAKEGAEGADGAS